MSGLPGTSVFPGFSAPHAQRCCGYPSDLRRTSLQAAKLAKHSPQLRAQAKSQTVVQDKEGHATELQEAEHVRLENEKLREVLAAKVAALEQAKAEALAQQFAELNRKATLLGASVQSPFDQAKALAAMETPAKAAEPSATAVGHKSGSKKARKPRAAPSTATNTHKGQQDVQKAVPGPILPGLDTEPQEQAFNGNHGSSSSAETHAEMQPSSSGPPASLHSSAQPLLTPPAPIQDNGAGRSRPEQATQSPADAASLCQGRSHWLYFLHPAQPAESQTVTIYFNRNTSDILRYSARVEVHVKFNSWELESSSGAWLDLRPSSAPHDHGADWWSAEVTVPSDAYEMNYIFSDGVGTTDNNGGLDYLSEVDGHMTRQAWTEAAPERMVEAEERRKAEERRLWEKAEQERQVHLAAQDLEQAQHAVAYLRNIRPHLMKGAMSSLSYPQADGQSTPVWQTVPPVLHPGMPAKLLYNLRAGPLNWLTVDEGQHLVLHLGHNEWEKPTDVEMRRVEGHRSNDLEDWWEADITVGRTDMAISFVIKFWEHFDNNNEQSYKLGISPPDDMAEEDWFKQLTERLQEAHHESRKQAEQQEARKARRRSDQRAAVEAKVKAVKRRQLHHMLYTQPSSVLAGSSVTLFYNPTNTNLSQAARIFVHGGWNRWTHPKALGPLELSPPQGAEQRWSVTIEVPANAYKMDLVFADVESGDGNYDNCGGADYHLPVEGSKLSEPGLYIAQIAVEMAPICKVGGLGDVVTALGRAVKEQGHHMEIILPRYDFFLQSPLLGATRYETEFDWGGCRVFVSSCTVEGLTCFFIEPQNGMFHHSGVYKGNDDAVRFDFFCKAALEFLLQTGRQPDILHCHDWSTAGVAQSFWQDYQPYGLWRPKVVFTIHNADFGMARLGSAAHHCQRFTTVSPSYAFEIGGLPAFSGHVSKFFGIRNGIDTDIWDPQNDPFLARHYGPEDVVEGKRAARIALRNTLGLTDWEDRPLVGVITRLTAQKGIQLIKHGAWRTRDRGGQFVLLGSAPDPKVQAEFDGLAGQMSGDANAAFCFSFDEPLSHLIYAACDIVLVPSIFEPCGLTQLIAMRYGTIPVVRSTGGLHDTVFDVDWDKGRAAWELEGCADWQMEQIDATNGFAFDGTDAGALDSALNRAFDAYWNDRQWFHSLQARVMRQDWSWARPALDYIDVYHSAMTS
ncbi:hypothetical protein WJX84_010271 [Apatococcus fuscideae]|uniref:starch synthase n=1 Tax=Apatococcus fuscideae TaxID=2026836 RepID=A0AAW1TG09_9CHLO